MLAVELLADEGLVCLHDLAHARLDALEVVVGEVGTAGQLEVVVEAVGDRRTDGVLGAGEQVGHGLGEHVRGRVAQHLAAVVGVGGDDRDRGVVLDRALEDVPLDLAATVTRDLGGERRLRQAPADRRCDVARGDAVVVVARRAVGQRDRDRHEPATLPVALRQPLARFTRAEFLKLRQELTSTSSQDEFAKWAKIRRSYDKVLAELGTSKRETDTCSLGLALSLTD